MIRFFKNSFIFAIPFILIISFTLVVDPYENFGYFNIISVDLKRKVSYNINYALWKVVEFSRNPRPNILLGDSRMNRIKVKEIRKFSGIDYYNFAYGGGTLQEICNTFWFAADKINLKKVYIGINFEIYNLSKSYDRVNGAINILENPLLYLINRDVLNASFRLVKSKLSGKVKNIETPRMSKNEFWKYQINIAAKRNYANYVYPQKLYYELRKIADYCRKNEIELSFVILPTHVTLQEKIEAYGLAKSYQKFLSDLRDLNTVYDFNYPNQLTNDRNNFSDPFHAKETAISHIVRQIWGGEKGIGRLYKIQG